MLLCDLAETRLAATLRLPEFWRVCKVGRVCKAPFTAVAQHIHGGGLACRVPASFTESRWPPHAGVTSAVLTLWAATTAHGVVQVGVGSHGRSAARPQTGDAGGIRTLQPHAPQPDPDDLGDGIRLAVPRHRHGHSQHEARFARWISSQTDRAHGGHLAWCHGCGCGAVGRAGWARRR